MSANVYEGSAVLISPWTFRDGVVDAPNLARWWRGPRKRMTARAAIAPRSPRCSRGEGALALSSRKG
ncbi:MAG: hypothetical protein U0234_08665 [Sandaracinus sp.]